MTTNDGFWEAGLEGSVDRLNACLVQLGTLANRPAAGQKGRIYVLTDSGLEGQSFVDDGVTWNERIFVNPATTVAGLRTLGTGALQAAAGDHGHTFSEDVSQEATNTGADDGNAAVQKRTDITASSTKSVTTTLSTTELTRVVGAGSFHIYLISASSTLELKINGIVITTKNNIAKEISHIIRGSSEETSGSRAVECVFTNTDGGTVQVVRGHQVMGIAVKI